MTSLAEQANLSNYGGYTPKKEKSTLASKADLSKYGGYLEAGKKNNKKEIKQPEQSLQNALMQSVKEVALSPFNKPAEKFNRAVESTGLPAAAKGFIGGPISQGINISNALGTNIQKPKYPQLANEEDFKSPSSGPIEDIARFAYQKGPEALGNIAAGGVMAKGIGAVAGGVSKADQIRQALQKEQLAAQEHANAKAEAQSEFGQQNPQQLMKTSEQKAAEAEQAKQYSKENPPPVNVPEKPPQITPEQVAFKQTGVNKEVSNLLDPKIAHNQRFSRDIVNRIEGTKNSETGKMQGGRRQVGGHLYDEAENTLAKDLVTIPKTADMTEINKDLEAILKYSRSQSPESIEAIKNTLMRSRSAMKGDVVPAKDYLKSYRAVMQLAGQKRIDAWKRGTTEHDRKNMLDEANELDAKSDQMSQILESSVGDKWKKPLSEANSYWSKEIAPLDKNSIYQQMRRYGSFKGDLIEAISETGKGNEILQQMVFNDPKLSQLALGQRYAAKPQELYKANELAKPFLEQHPELQKLSEEQSQLAHMEEQNKYHEQFNKVYKDISALIEESQRAKEMSKTLESTDFKKTASKQERIDLQNRIKESRAKKATLLKGWGKNIKYVAGYELWKHFL